MTEKELDKWILENVFGWTDVEWKGAGGNAISTWPAGWIGRSPEDQQFKRYSEGGFCAKPEQFARVKREIEKRGWDWGAGYRRSQLLEYRYRFLIYYSGVQLGDGYAETEEMAGCVAVKEAIEHGR